MIFPTPPTLVCASILPRALPQGMVVISRSAICLPRANEDDLRNRLRLAPEHDVYALVLDSCRPIRLSTSAGSVNTLIGWGGAVSCWPSDPGGAGQGFTAVILTVVAKQQPMSAAKDNFNQSTRRKRHRPKSSPEIDRQNTRGACPRKKLETLKASLGRMQTVASWARVRRAQWYRSDPACDLSGGRAKGEIKRKIGLPSALLDFETSLGYSRDPLGDVNCLMPSRPARENWPRLNPKDAIWSIMVLGITNPPTGVEQNGGGAVHYPLDAPES